MGGLNLNQLSLCGQSYAHNLTTGGRQHRDAGVEQNICVSLRIETDQQGFDVDNGNPSTIVGTRAIYPLETPFRILASSGTTFEDRDPSGYHLFLVLGLDFQAPSASERGL
jgi:hypothetical protein